MRTYRAAAERRPTHLSLFSGIGGLDLAAERAGFRTVAFCESDLFCREVLARNWPGVPCHPDVRELDGGAYRDVDLVTGGFPCQPFSLAGKRSGTADDRWLWPAMLGVVADARPAWVVGENVAGFVSLGLDQVESDLEGLGYAVRTLVFPAGGVGARHLRQRCFVVARRDADRRREPARPLDGGPLGLRPAAGAGADAARLVRPRQRCCGGKEFEPADVRHPLPDADREQARRLAVARENRRLWAAEPGVGRVADGVPRRMDRLRSLGNAVVPQQAFPILSEIRRLLAHGSH